MRASLLIVLAAPITASLVTFLLLRAMLGSALRAIAVDQPNERSLHSEPIPRIGGVAIMMGLAVAALMLGEHWIMLGLAAALAVLSFLDDRRGLPIGARLAGHLAAATAYVALLDSQPSAIVAIATIIAIVWLTNLYNFMDGADGLAGGMTLIGFTAYSIGFARADDLLAAALCASIAACALAFLKYNFHPARVFMGDGGSVPLGFLAGTIGLFGWHSGAWPMWFPLIVFAPFVADATVTIARRALRGEKFWRPHRSHYYQRLVRLGWGHRATALAEYALMLVSAATALALDIAPPAGRWLLAAAIVATFIVAGAAVDRAWRRAGIES